MTVVSRRLIYKFLLDFVYPNRCPICGSFIKWDELLCKNCECKLPFHKKILCEKCGKDKCLDHDSLHFDSIYTLMRYEDICVKAIHQLKDDRQLNFAEYSAKLLGNVLRENGIAQQADIITSVPMHRSKRRKRGYDQAKKLAHFTAMELGKEKIIVCLDGQGIPQNSIPSQPPSVKHTQRRYISHCLTMQT